MLIHIITEPAFEESSWCVTILDGLLKTLTRKKISYQRVSQVPFKGQDGESQFLIIIATDKKWITSVIAQCTERKIHPVVLNSYLGHSGFGVYSSVSSDIKQSIYYLLNYLKKQGKIHPAIYGINQASAIDISRRNSFLDFAKDYADENDVYYNNGSIQGCFDDFEKNISKYDCVICANDYAAISLLKNLEKTNYPKEKLLPVSYGNTRLFSVFANNFLTISLCYDEYGKAAVSICETLDKNPALLYMDISIKWKIGANTDCSMVETFGDLPVSDRELMVADQLFYGDAEMCDMIKAEKMLATCDKIDIEILTILLKGGSYEQAAEKCFISHNTVKYRVKKLVELCGFESKRQFISFISKYYFNI